MSAHPAPAPDAIALQLAAAIDKYASDVARMIEGRLDLQLYREVNEQVDALRRYSASIPGGRVEWVELLISHAELVHCLWRTPHGRDSAPGERSWPDVLERHSDAVGTLRRLCLAVLSRRPAS